jgi:hypothetical protein
MSQGHDHVIGWAFDFHPKVVRLTWFVEFVLGLPLGGGPDSNSSRPWNNIYSLPWKNPCRFFIHVKKLKNGSLSLELLMWSELGQPLPFWPMRDLRLQWTWIVSLIREVALRLMPSCGRSSTLIFSQYLQMFVEEMAKIHYQLMVCTNLNLWILNKLCSYL